MSKPLWSLSAHEMVQRVKQRQVSRVELVQAHLNRIENLNPVLNAFVEVCADDAIAQAALADSQHDNRGHLPLDGVPFSIKEFYDVKGMKHTEGLPEFAERRSPADEVVITRLREAGAIIVGKTNQPDLQIRWNTVSHLYGATRNPRNLKKSPGGSSGGDAAAVAAGLAAVGLGADYGGSIRLPAMFCQLYGLRASAGRIPSVATVPPFDSPPTVDLMSANGPLARCVEDLERVYRVIAGADPADPNSVPVPIDYPPQSSSRPTIALMSDDTGAILSDAVRRQLEASAQILRDAGYTVIEAAIPNAKRAPDLWVDLVGTELMQVGMPQFEGLLGKANRQHINDMFSHYRQRTQAADYINALTERRKIVRELALWMENYPVVLCPVAGTEALEPDFDDYLGPEKTQELFNQMRSVPWVNLCGLPSLGLPNGVQLVGRRFYELQLLQVAAALQAALGPAPVAEL
ncbi:MAG TPA: amidase family protein [Burkholderiaceae bacterium]|nr:amidase family protein [Burkholderiaceae bacterium]